MSWPAPGLTEGVLTRRFWAWCIDFAIVLLISGVLFVVLSFIGLITFGLGFGLLALVPWVPLAYHILFVAGPRAATPGQVMLGLVVATERDFGKPDVLQAVLFTLGLWLTLSVAFVLLGVAFFTERRRTLHDIVAGVVVVRSDALAAMQRNSLTPGDSFAKIPPTA